MNCPKCGTILKPNVKFCRQCGTQVSSINTNQTTHLDQYQYSFNFSNEEKPKYNVDSLEGHEKQYNYSYDYSNKTTPDYNLNASHQEQNDYNYLYSKFNYIPTQTAGDEKYIEAFVGPNYQNFKSIKFSFGTLIFGIFYFIYRKMYSIALIYLFLITSSNLLLGELAGIVNFIIKLYMAFKFNELYMAHAERKVEQIKQSNFDKTSTELLEECRKKGGVIFKATVIIMIVSAVFLPLFESIIEDIYFESFNQPEEVETQDNYYKIKDLRYSKHTGLTLIPGDGDIHSHAYHKDDIHCYVNIKAQNNTYSYPTEEAYLTYISQQLDPTATTSEITAYNEWKKIKTNYEGQEFYTYAIIKGDTLYSIDTANDLNSSTTCTEIYSNLMDSTKFTN